jgi:predicted dithiol-disulfide oxidoreductase (DUF899 family)
MNQHVRSPAHHRVVSREEWLKARKAHLRNEKALTRMRDMVSAERRELPWVKVEKDYVFDTPAGKKALADLFGGNSQLIVHHFMWRWDLDQGCKSCSLQADHAEGALVHLQHHDVSYWHISRARSTNSRPIASDSDGRRRAHRHTAAISTSTIMSRSATSR